MFTRLVILPMVLLGMVACAQAAAATPATSAAATTSPPLATLQKQAATGDAKAEVALGRRLMQAKDPADKAAAAKWFREAAMQGNADGEWRLGSAYLGGAGVTRNVATGLSWMRKSLSDQSAEHMAIYGYFSALSGTMSGNNEQVADGMKWIRRSADAGSPQGMTMLALFSLSGAMGMPKDKAAAQQWLLKASRAGDAQAQSVLGQMYVFGKVLGPPNVAAGLQWLRESAGQGDAEAAGILGYLLVTGDKHVPKVPSEGIRWAEQAAAKHDVAGYYALGYAYQHGVGVPVDPAKSWYNYAAAERVDIKHQFSDVGDHMSLVAKKLSTTQLEKLQKEVATIPVPETKPGGNNFAAASH